MADERDPEVVRLAGRVRELRVAAGLTQQEVADSIGMNRVTVARLEAGLHDLGSSRLGALAEVLGVEPGAFWE